jgi:hypothetical protein
VIGDARRPGVRAITKAGHYGRLSCELRTDALCARIPAGKHARPQTDGV